MNDEVGISVVVTTYGRANRIEKCIESIVKQKYKNYEIIIVDDNGKETENQKNTEKKLKKYKEILREKMKYIINEINLGANKSRNIGIQNSKNDYISFLDDDDEYTEERLEEVNKILKQNEYDLIYTGALMIDEKKCREKYRYVVSEKENVELRKQILVSNFIGSNSFVVLKKKKVIEIGYYDEVLKAAQDWDLWIRIIFNEGKVYGIDKPLVRYYINSDLTRISNNLEKIKNAMEIVFNKVNTKFLNSFDKDFQNKIIFGQKKYFMEYYYKKNDFINFRSVFNEIRKKFKDKRIGNKNKLRYYLSYFKIKI